MKLLLVEDDCKLSKHLELGLRGQGFNITLLAHQNEVIDIMNSHFRPDFIVLDRLLGVFDTKQILPDIRRKWASTPLIVLSAISTPNERTDLLNLGADDYVSKPFSTQELIARIRALLRRTSVPVGNYIQIGNLIVDKIQRLITVDNRTESLPAREFNLLKTLANEPKRIWSKDELLDYVWGQASDVDTNVVESTIANIRKKMTNLKATPSIRNLRNMGYWIEE